MKVWITKEGDQIPYKKLEDSHLLNILRWIEKRAAKGITLIDGGGHDLDEMWYCETPLKGKEVFDWYDYKGLKNEAVKRGLKP